MGPERHGGAAAWPGQRVASLPLLTMLLATALIVLAACSGNPGGGTAGSTHPATGAGRTGPGGSAGGVTLPIKIVQHGRATLELVPVTINGHGPYVFMLDSGSSVSSVSRQLARRIRLPAGGSSTVIRGVVTSERVPLVTIASWKLGPARLAPDRVAVLNLARTGGSVAGLLGSDELRHFGAITIDFTHQKLRLAQP